MDGILVIIVCEMASVPGAIAEWKSIEDKRRNAYAKEQQPAGSKRQRSNGLASHSQHLRKITPELVRAKAIHGMNARTAMWPAQQTHMDDVEGLPTVSSDLTVN